MSSPVPTTGGHGRVLDAIRVGGARVTLVEHAPSLALGEHAHEEAKLCVLLAGGTTEKSGVDIDELRAFEVFARSPFTRHENQYHAAGARELLVEIDPSEVRVRRAWPPGAPRSASVAMGRRLARAFFADGGARAREVRAAVDAILDALAERPRRGPPAWLEAARERLVERLDEPPSLAELARGAGVHPIHLAQSFRRCFGATTRGFVRAHRVFAAVEAIGRGTSLADVAARVGFADQPHMTRAVRASRGTTPGTLRRRIVRPA